MCAYLIVQGRGSLISKSEQITISWVIITNTLTSLWITNYKLNHDIINDKPLLIIDNISLIIYKHFCTAHPTPPLFPIQGNSNNNFLIFLILFFPYKVFQSTTKQTTTSENLNPKKSQTFFLLILLTSLLLFFYFIYFYIYFHFLLILFYSFKTISNYSKSPHLNR